VNRITIPPPLVSLVITTRNRKNDLCRALRSCFAQDYKSIEVLVFDDASEDGTPDLVQSSFPSARLFGGMNRVGLIANRSRAFREASGVYLVSLDDDAYFTGTDTISRTVRLFESDQTIGAVAIPYIEPLDRRSLSNMRAPFKANPGDELRTFVGCAHAVRRDVALAIGGYRDFFIHQGEERDFCLRLRAAGCRIIYGSGEPIVHMVSPNRDLRRVAYYGVRNQILFEMLNAPFPDCILRIAWVAQAAIRYRFSWTNLPTKLGGLAAGLVESIRRVRLRRPVDRKTYYAHLSLPAHGPVDSDVATMPVPSSADVRL
jgi:GT2 family glycosyltransferase